MASELQPVIPVPSQPGAVDPRPYPPSTINRFMRFVDGLPIPYWLTYLALFVVESVLVHLLAWLDGWLPALTFSPLLLIFPLWTWGPLLIIRYLDSVSQWALSVFTPLLDAPEGEIRRLKYEFSNMPARSALISAILWSCVYLIFAFAAFQPFYAFFHYSTLYFVIGFVDGLKCFFIGSVLYYHTIRQLLLVNRTVRMAKPLNLFRLDPVYAFSLVTSRTGVAWVILDSITLLLFPIQLAPVPVLSMMMVQVVLVLGAFVLPLWVVHQRLVAEKHRLVAALNQRVESTLVRLHHCLDDHELGEVDQLNSAITGLEAEREILARIPTWPWRAGVISCFLTIVVIPILLFLLQLALDYYWLSK